MPTDAPSSTSELIYAPLPLRLLQASLEVLTVFALLVAIAFTSALRIDVMESIRPQLTLIMTYVFWGYWILIAPSFEHFASATPAMRLCRLRVIGADNRRTTFLRLVLRSLLRPFALIGLLWYTDWNKPWLHDSWTQTRIVRTQPSHS